MRNSEKKTSGFSFIELLVSFAVSFLLILGTIQLTLHSMMVKKRSDFRLNECSLISSQLEQLKSLFFSGGEWQEENHSLTIKAPGGHQFFILEWTLLSDPAGNKSIKMSCFPESAPQRKTEVLLFLSEELGF